MKSARGPRRRRLLDRFGKGLAALGGFAVAAAVLVLVGFMVKEIVPLFQGARVGAGRTISLEDAGIVPGRALAAGVDEYLESAFVLDDTGRFYHVDLRTGRALGTGPAIPLGNIAPGGDAAGGGVSEESVRLTAAAYLPLEKAVVVAASDGRVGWAGVEFPVRFEDSERRIGFAAAFAGWRRVDPAGRPIAQAAMAKGGGVAAAITADGRLLFFAEESERSFFGPAQVREYRHDLTAQIAGYPTAVALSPDGRTLLAGTGGGLLYQWDVRSPASPRLVAVFAAAGERAGEVTGAGGGLIGAGPAVTALQFLIGGETAIVADAAGGVSAWFPVPDAASPTGRRLARIHVFEPHEAPVLHVAPSQRNRSFLTVDAAGVVKMHHSTSEQTFFSLETGLGPPGQGPVAAQIAPRGDGQALLAGHELWIWDVHNPHPEVSLKTLFAPVHYEGYAAPGYVWQSTGGSDAFEPKLSLVPLAFGTLKGTLYALLFALPLGVLGAVYTSQFMHPRLRAVVKPTVELMAGMPSVVLGFLAGLWLAPLAAQHFAALAATALLLPGLILLAAWAWHRLPQRLRPKAFEGWEAALLIPVALAGGALAFALGPLLEEAAMRGDWRSFLSEVFGLPYDVRNALVAGVAMGFAVIPIVFSISEDALSSVPQSLIAGSLALGVNRWRTVTGVVIPTAMPGIVSSVMVGIGRAVGETMIVLMATGNTPVMNMSPFQGFRALSANIAVEMPEAPVGGTLYRVLFVTALLLFAFTFAMNTVGELIRRRMTERVSRL